LLLQGCERRTHISELERLKESKTLRVGTLYSQRSFFYDQDDQPTGFDYELLSEFSQYLGVHLKLVPLYSQSDLYPALAQNRVDLLAASLSATPELSKQFRYSPDIYLVDSKLVYRKGNFRPSSLSELDAPVGVVAGSVHHQLLIDEQNSFPEIELDAQDQLDADELLRQVASGERPYALVDDKALALNQRYYPELAEAFTLKKDTPIVWLARRSPDDTLYSALIEFLGQRHQDGTIAKLTEKYFGQFQEFDYVDTRTFLEAANRRLPKYQAWFEQYSGDIDWRLLAAMSYQESHWRPKARSFTGVRGMMMLTLPTAKQVKVSNRLDPEQSIRGGAQYLANLISRVPDSIHADEKIWFALASYNLGLGHVLDARKITRLQGADPDSWTEVKERLPLLMQKKWYKKTTYGYARGKEAYDYVNNIRLYYQSLVLLDNKQREQEARETQETQEIEFKRRAELARLDQATPAPQGETLETKTSENKAPQTGVTMSVADNKK
jgi:membrane-bound lytic murein transglycosylase F